jgi:Domain of unknown function (DUF4214)
MKLPEAGRSVSALGLSVAIRLLAEQGGRYYAMITAMKGLFALLLILSTATSVSAQAAGNWQRVHGQVQAVQGDRLTLKADDGRTIDVDIKQVSPAVRGAMEPNLGVTVTGFPGQSADRFTARYIVQDNAGAAASVPSGGGESARILPLVPLFADSAEFKVRAASMTNDPNAAGIFVTQLYRGLLGRDPSDAERASWSRRLLDSRDVQGTVAAFVQSPEYAARNQSDRDAITGLYQAFFARTPSAEEIRTWERQIARR